MSSSLKSCSTFGYAQKKMWRPVSYQSPSASFQAATLPPSTSRLSRRMGVWPASVRYLAQDSPTKPAPAQLAFDTTWPVCSLRFNYTLQLVTLCWEMGPIGGCGRFEVRSVL